MEQISELVKWFWGQVQYVWAEGLFGVDIASYIIALGITLIFVILSRPFSKYMRYIFNKITAKSSIDLHNAIVEALIPPVRLIPIIFGMLIAGYYLSLKDLTPGLDMPLGRSLTAFVVFWSLYRVAEPLADSLVHVKKLLTRTMMQWMVKFTKVLVVFIGAAVILEIWGIAVGPLLTGLGLFGAAVALGAQDLIKNLIGGVSVIAEKRFNPGEWIKVEGVVEGTVEDIGFRSTKVRRFDKAPMHVPNSALSDSVVTNFSRMTHRRISWKIGVTYSTTTEQLKLIRDEILSYLENNQDFAPAEEVATFVRVDSFNSSSIDFLVYCFTKTTNWGEWLVVKEEFAIAIKKIVEDKAKTSFAFPSTSIYLESLPGEAAEIFKPPNDS